jgi:hypothetical protein
MEQPVSLGHNSAYETENKSDFPGRTDQFFTVHAVSPFGWLIIFGDTFGDNFAQAKPASRQNYTLNESLAAYSCLALNAFTVFLPIFVPYLMPSFEWLISSDTISSKLPGEQLSA